MARPPDGRLRPEAVWREHPVYEHWIEVATMPAPGREIRLEFFTPSFEDGFVHVLCQRRIPAR